MTDRTALVVLVLMLTLAACGGDREAHSDARGTDDPSAGGPPPLDPDRDPLPAVIEALHIPLERIRRISKFRSGVGHDFSDGVESCRSMKHYLHPLGGEPGEAHDPSWSTLEIRSPLTGTIREMRDEWGRGRAGFGMTIVSEAHEQIAVTLFHVAPDDGIEIGRRVEAGERLGRHSTDETYHDIAVAVRGVADEAGEWGGLRYVSWFDVMSDEVFAAFAEYDIDERDRFLIPRETRDEHPLSCDERRRFTARDPLAGEDDSGIWVTLGSGS